MYLADAIRTYPCPPRDGRYEELMLERLQATSVLDSEPWSLGWGMRRNGVKSLVAVPAVGV